MENILMKQKDIYLMPFPFSDLSKTKVRPVLIVSNNTFNNISSDVLVCVITSQKTTHTIPFSNKDLIDGKLHQESYIKPSSLFKIDKELCIKKIGTIHEQLLNTIKKEIISLF